MTALEVHNEIPEATRLVKVPDEADACDVFVREGPVVWIFHFTRVQPDYAHLHANVGVEWITTASGERRESMGMPMAGIRPIHTDWRSGSSIDSFERRLRQYFDPTKKLGISFTQIVQFAAQRLDEFILQAGDLEEPSFIESSGLLVKQYLIRPIWPESLRPVIWYGQGEAGKGVMAVGAGVSLCYGIAFANLRTTQMSRGLVYVDYEDSFDEFNVRVNRFCNGIDKAPINTLRRFDPHGRLFIDIVHTLKAKVAAIGGCDGYIIDSAIPACGGDVIKPEPVGAFFQALAILGKPAIVIGHETKDSPTSADAPFGSQLWRTSSAMTVNFQGSNEPRQDLAGNWVRDLVVRCTKANNVPRFSPLAFQLAFTPDGSDERSPELFKAGTPSATWVRQVNPTEVSLDLQSRLSPIQQLIGALRGGRELTVKELIDQTSLTAKQIAHTTDRHREVFASEGGGRGAGNAARWRLLQRGDS